MKILKILCCMAAVCLTAFSLSGCSLQKADNSLGRGTISIPTYAVKAPTAGKLIGLISEKGERISKGQPLFAIGDAKLDKQVKDLATQVAKAEADLKRMQQGTPTAAPVADTSLAQANVAAAQQKAAKMNSLLAQGAVSRNQAQAAQDELQRAIAQLQAASVSFKPASPAEIDAQQKLIVQLKAQQAAAKAQQEKNEGNSPCTGIITDLQAANNATVQKDQVILHIKAVDSCSITLNVSAAQTKKLKAGMPVNIKAAETPAPFSGKISSIDGTKITVTSDQKPEDLKDGVKVEISLAA